VTLVTVNDFRSNEELSRQLAAERMADIAYALTAGGTLELRSADGRIRVPVAEEVRLERRTSSDDGRVRVSVELSWSA
jgi:amphi-Trp domain-containing protein